jgi:hypothetical protein
VPENSIASGNPAKIRNLYVFKYKLEQKYKIIKDIMIEFVEYMNYIGINGRYIPSDAYSKVYFKKKSGKPYFQILIWHNETSNEFQEVLKDLQRECKELIILIFSSKIVNKFKEELKNEKINYFDLEKKVLYGELYEYTVDVRIFLQRFGITFDYN